MYYSKAIPDVRPIFAWSWPGPNENLSAILGYNQGYNPLVRPSCLFTQFSLDKTIGLTSGIYCTVVQNLLVTFKGLWDQALALTWVRDHIAAFGGDPNNVTLIGEGSGAVCVGYHIVSPRSTGLFSKVVMMSGSPVSPASRDD